MGDEGAASGALDWGVACGRELGNSSSESTSANRSSSLTSFFFVSSSSVPFSVAVAVSRFGTLGRASGSAMVMSSLVAWVSPFGGAVSVIVSCVAMAGLSGVVA